MARLFVTPREIDYISDLTKEITKDVRGQKIFYYRIREDLTDVHDVYEESPDKIFDAPVEIWLWLNGSQKLFEQIGLDLRNTIQLQSIYTPET